VAIAPHNRPFDARRLADGLAWMVDWVEEGGSQTRPYVGDRAGGLSCVGRLASV